MASVEWRRKALDDLERLDRWREEDLDLPPVGAALIVLVDQFFAKVDLGTYRPGAPVEVQGEPADLLLVLLRVKRSEPYKLFYRALPDEDVVEVRRVRHPRQKSLA